MNQTKIRNWYQIIMKVKALNGKEEQESTVKFESPKKLREGTNLEGRMRVSLEKKVTNSQEGETILMLRFFFHRRTNFYYYNNYFFFGGRDYGIFFDRKNRSSPKSQSGRF